ncbi:aspartate aminotransferase family protein [Nocardioides bigeumensis]|uniref:Acetyl ornithine aminotransferase family protein n=1 Tax=Nocardioides bigeumensis TaxID=433657 RepID=A0ABN2YZQ7_9ACTN
MTDDFPVSPDQAPRVSGSLPGPLSRAELDAQGEVFYAGLTHGTYPFVARRKSGWLVEDLDGNVFVDLVSSSASVPFGAGRADLVAVAAEQLAAFGNEDSHAVTNPLMSRLARRLLGVTPASLTRVDLSLNGTEAVETAVRFMRRATGRQLILGFYGGYHGESTTTAALGAEHHEIGQGTRGLGGGFVHAPYPRPFRSPFAPPRPGGSGDSTVDFIRDHLLFHAVDPREVAGVVIEPVLGSGGVVVPPASFWTALRALCDEHGWLLCLDEVKTGFGRTGQLFAAELWDLQPDLMCLGKAMGGGVMPIGAVLGTEAVLGTFDDVSTGSTWAWLPAACAVALASLDVFEAEGVLANVRALHEVSAEVLAPLVDHYEQVGDVRVQGCFVGVELVTDKVSQARAADLQEALAAAILARGVLVDSSTTTINIQPSLVMPPDLLRSALALVVDAVDEVLG